MGYQIGFILQIISLCAINLATLIPRFVEELGPIFGCSVSISFICFCVIEIATNQKRYPGEQLDYVVFTRVILFLNLLMDSVFTIYWYKFMAMTFETRINVLIYGIIYIGMVGKMLSWNEVKFPLVQKKKEE